MNESELLEREYSLAINQNDPWYFFLNLSNYVNFVHESKSLAETVSRLEKEKEDRISELLNLEKRSVKELKESREKLETIINKHDGLRERLKKSDPIADGLTSIDLYLTENLHTGGTVSEVLNRFLQEVAWDLQSFNMAELLKPFMVQQGKIHVATFSKTFSLREQLSKQFDSDRNISHWGYWDLLSLLKDKIVFTEEMNGPNINIVDQTLFSEYVHLKWEIMDNRKKDTFPRLEQKKFHHGESQVEKYKHFLSRIHLYFLREISKQKDIGILLPLEFNPETSRLTVSDKSISFRKFTDQYHVLSTIFSETNNLSKEWFFSELGERMDQYKKYKDKDFHNYLTAINRRVATETGLKDVFLTTTHSVKINPKYLKKI